MKKILFVILFVLGINSLSFSQSVDPKLYALRKNVILALSKYGPMDIGVGIIHVQKKDTMLFNNNYLFPMQSVYKFPIAVAVIEKMSKGEFGCDKKIKIKKDLILENTHSPLRDKYGVKDMELSVCDLLSFMVTESDNNACDIILKKIVSPKKVNKFVKSLGVDSINIISTEAQMHANPDLAYDNYSTPLAMCNLLYKIFYTDVLINMSRDYLKVLMFSKTDTRLRKYLPEDVLFYHKTGTGPTNPKGVIQSVNDVGIMEIDKNNHIIISVFMREIDITYEQAEEIMAKIGEIVYKTYSN
ncbi:MAG: class A beta-lactamase [Bacteroidales bacterium]